MTGFMQRWEEEKYAYPRAFDVGMSFLLNQNPLLLERTKHAIDGDRIFVQLAEPMTKTRSPFELHKEYIDIHVLLQGREKQSWSSMPPSEAPFKDELAENDVAFYPAQKNPGTLLLSPGQYVAYLPWELHAPCGAVENPERIVKAVIKIRRSCLT